MKRALYPDAHASKDERSRFYSFYPGAEARGHER